MMFAMTACGETPASSQSGEKAAAQAEKQAAQDKEAAKKEKAAQQVAAAKRLAAQTARYQQCADVSRQLNTKLNDLNSRLSVGLPFADYSDEVGDVSIAYDRMYKQLGKTGPADLPCIGKVLAPLEVAVNAYISAYNRWNDCMNDDYCEMEGSTLEKAQGSWSKAERQIARSERGLSVMNPAT
jgi:hypothetical protein